MIDLTVRLFLYTQSYDNEQDDVDGKPPSCQPAVVPREVFLLRGRRFCYSRGDVT